MRFAVSGARAGARGPPPPASAGPGFGEAGPPAPVPGFGVAGVRVSWRAAPPKTKDAAINQTSGVRTLKLSAGNYNVRYPAIDYMAIFYIARSQAVPATSAATKPKPSASPPRSSR